MVMKASWGPTLGSIELIWHRANTRSALDAFFASGVRWVECDARVDPSGVVRVSHEPLDGAGDGSAMELDGWLAIVRGEGRAAKIDLKEGGLVIDHAIAAAARAGFEDADLWFNAAIEIPSGEEGFRRLAAVRPGARVSCPIDTLAPYLVHTGAAAYPILDRLAEWGVSYLSIGACVEGARMVIGSAHERGWPINVWDVESLDDLERASAMCPDSITADLDSFWPPVRSRCRATGVEA